MPATRARPNKPWLTKAGLVQLDINILQFDGFESNRPVDTRTKTLLEIDWAIERLNVMRGRLVETPTGIDRYTDAIRTSIRHRNWFGAIFLALAMPDICATLEDPTQPKVGYRYEKWFNTYISNRFDQNGFNSKDCYLLRCAALHQGVADFKNASSKIRFTNPAVGGTFHNNMMVVKEENLLVLQADIFCEDFCVAVEYWKFEMAGNADVVARMQDLMYFRELKNAAD